MTNQEVPMTNKTNRRALIAQSGLLTAAMTVPGAAHPQMAKSLRQSLVGAWRLIACVETDIKTGEVFLPMGDHPRGFILYTPDGYMSAQLSSPDRRRFTGDDMYRGAPVEYAAAGVSYLAYSGPYYVDEARRTIEHEMGVSLFPNWEGQRQVRVPRLDGDTLVLATDQPTLFAGSLKTARITWRRARPNL
jgi:hypothetical protein